VHKSLQRIREGNLATFVPWGPSSIQVMITRRSPFVHTSNRVTGFMLANHTSVATLLERMIKQFNKLRDRNAYLQEFRKEEIFRDDLGELDDSRAKVQEVIEEYRLAETSSYADFPSPLDFQKSQSRPQAPLVS
jgi:tubulin gamma